MGMYNIDKNSDFMTDMKSYYGDKISFFSIKPWLLFVLNPSSPPPPV